MHAVLTFSLWFCLLVISPISAQQLSPITTQAQLTLDGMEMQLPYTVQLSLEPIAQGQQRIQARISAPVNPLLPVLQQILDRQRPHDNCAGYRGDNWVVGSPSLSFAVRGEQLNIRVAAGVDMWQCIENPFGSPLKNKVSGAVELQLVASWQLLQQRVALSVAVGHIAVSGDLGRAAKLWADTQGESIRAAAQRRLSRESMPDLELPQALLALGASVQSARFTESDGQPVAEFVLHAELSPANWRELQRRFWSTPGDSP